MAKDDGIIGVQEKKELSKLIEQEFNTIIMAMKQEIQYTQGEILEEAQKKFGIEALNIEIGHLKEKILFIEKKKQEMGFKHDDGFGTRTSRENHYEQEVNPNTKAGRFYYMKIARSVDIRALENQRSVRLKKLWLNNERTVVQKLIEQEVDMKFLPKPKKEK